MSDPFKIPCPHCAVNIEFPPELHGSTAPCPACGCTVALRVPGHSERTPPPLPAPAAPQRPALTAPAPTAKIKRKSEFIGAGCFVQGIGLLLLFFFPIGTIIGVVMLLWGSQLSIKYICGNCGNPVADKKVRLCAACHFQLKPSGFFS